MRGINLKNKKNAPKIYIFEVVRGCNGSEKSKFAKSISMGSTKSTRQTSSSWLILEEE